MNGYQRITAALKGEKTDRRPVMLHNFMFAAREAGLSMKEYRENPQKAAQAHIDAVEKYDLDAAFIDVDTATLAGSVGVPVDYPEDEPARVHMPRLTSLDEVNNLGIPEVARDEHIQLWVETCKIVKDYFGDDKFVRGNCDQAPFSLASMLRTPAEWMMDLISDDDNVFKLLEYSTEACCQFVAEMAKSGVDMVSNGDSPAGPEMISPEMYVTFAQKYEKRVVEEAHKHGMYYALHICGNTEIIVEEMIKTGADALELDYKTDINTIYEHCHDKVTFIGNIDPSSVLTYGTPALVEEKTKELLKIYTDSNRFIVNAGCAIPPLAPAINIKKFVEGART